MECTEMFWAPVIGSFDLKDCAVCRAPIGLADIFMLDPAVIEVPETSSKAIAVSQYLKPSRVAETSWAWTADPNGPRPGPETKSIVVQDIMAFKVRDLLKAFKDWPKALTVHVFYAGRAESEAFNDILNSMN
jgi:hypothetical protein